MGSGLGALVSYLVSGFELAGPRLFDLLCSAVGQVL
jgi:hypothetical protein